MSISISSVFASANLAPEGSVRWLEDVKEKAPGIYVLSLSQDIGSGATMFAEAPIDMDSMDRLIRARPYLEIDGATTNSGLLAQRLSSFWLPKEPILYIGQTKTPLRSRVGQFYNTRIGARSPHAGGWWVKALKCLADVHVHYAPTDDFEDSERVMLRYFVANAEVPPPLAGEQAHDGMPFANKEWWTESGQRIRRAHGIRYDTRNPK